MARAFSKIDALRLKEEHLTLLNELHSGIERPENNKKGIISAADAIITQEVVNILQAIPVEELNRDRGGLRIKNLRDAGYNTVADVATTNVYAIASINGISQDAAYTIKRIAQDITNKARKEIKIKLSVDSKTPKNTALVSAIYRYIRFSAIAMHLQNLLWEYEKQIKYAIEDLEPSIGSLKWLFTSSSNKLRAKEAYSKLVDLLNTDYGIKAKNLINAIRQNDIVDANTVWNDFKEQSITYFTTLENVYPGILGNDDEIYGLPEELAKEIQDECFFPDGLLCTLRRYQEWGVKYILHQGRVLLGDEMGLGKTVQAIASMVSLKNTGATHFVVVCPASVITNWCREIRKHSRLTVIKVHGTGRQYALNSWIKSGGVAVTTYETTGYFKLQDDFRFNMLVVDEAHYIKNSEAARSKNVKSISEHADRMLFMTGTALENKVDEMISLMDILQPNVAREAKRSASLASAPQFREKVAPVYYRRKRDQVLTELPELIESKEWCSLNPVEEEMYEKTLYSDNYMAVRRVSWNVSDLQYSSKAKRLKEIVEEAKEDDRKVIVFSFFLDTIKAVCELMGHACMNPINGSVSPERRQEIIDEFDKAPAGTVLPAQIQSGGTGLNIQSASVVVICEPQYKPSIENQAISRAYRMGQARNVLVYRLLCENTIDERITKILETKQAEFDAFADKSVAAIESIELDEKTMGDIIKEEIDRINAKRKNEISVT
ncbi:DEAD/DEAH box helicase [Eubacterium ruminantium]|uniref:DEAD/DEAH box helicase n=1 Tax=Eubacterium ruminantium TaxID=42322 RepID=UPI002478A860|nr:SNF2-related protein [Eubacterium ruminantium]